MEKTRILFLAANPWNTNRLALSEEFQRIQDLWERCNSREIFDLRHYPALRGDKLQEKVLRLKPHLIHFSGHGEENALLMSDASGENPHEIGKQALASLFGLCAPELKAVFLNACYSALQADAIVEEVDYLIGMQAEKEMSPRYSTSRSTPTHKRSQPPGWIVLCVFGIFRMSRHHESSKDIKTSYRR